MGWGVGFNIPPFAPSLTFCEPLQSGVMRLKLAGEQKFKQWSERVFLSLLIVVHHFLFFCSIIWDCIIASNSTGKGKVGNEADIF